MTPAQQARVGELIRQRRWAALATVSAEGLPDASMVAYAPDADNGCLLFHLSQLAVHTRNLLATRRASLVIGEEDSGDGDPQVLPRIVVTGRCEPVVRDDPDFQRLRAVYLGRLPDAEPRFDFSDFLLLRLLPESGNFVGGFGQARRLGAATVQGCLRASAP